MASPTREDLKRIAKARLKSAEILMNAEDWDGSAYMLGYVLECALKASACKSLRLGSYPSSGKKEDSHFMTHKFDQLLILSGLSDIFSANGPVQAFQNWSDFTQEFPGDWPSMRYNANHQNTFDRTKTKRLHENLVEKPEGVLTIIKKKRRW